MSDMNCSNVNVIEKNREIDDSIHDMIYELLTTPREAHTIEFISEIINEYIDIPNCVEEYLLNKLIPKIIEKAPKKMISIETLLDVLNKTNKYLLIDFILLNALKYNDFDIFVFLCSGDKKLDKWFELLKTYVGYSTKLSGYDELANICYNYAYIVLNENVNNICSNIEIHPEMIKNIIRTKMENVVEYIGKEYPSKIDKIIDEMKNINCIDKIFAGDYPLKLTKYDIKTKYFFDTLVPVAKAAMVGSVLTVSALLPKYSDNKNICDEILLIAKKYKNFELEKYILTESEKFRWQNGAIKPLNLETEMTNK